MRRDQFDLSEAVHEAEYALLPRPIDPATQKPIEPDHQFTVTLESDAYTEEKWVLLTSNSSKSLLSGILQICTFQRLPEACTSRPSIKDLKVRFQVILMLRFEAKYTSSRR